MRAGELGFTLSVDDVDVWDIGALCFGALSVLLLLAIFVVRTTTRDGIGLSKAIVSRRGGPIVFTVMGTRKRTTNAAASMRKGCGLRFSATSAIIISFDVVKCGAQGGALVQPGNSLQLGVAVRARDVSVNRIAIGRIHQRVGAARRVGGRGLGQLPSAAKGTIRRLMTARTKIDARGRLDSRCGIQNNDFSRGDICVGNMRMCHPLLVASKRRRNLDIVGDSVIRDVGFSTKNFSTRCKSGVSSILSVACGGPGTFRTSTSTDLLNTGFCTNCTGGGFDVARNVHCGAGRCVLKSLRAGNRCGPQFLSCRACVD